MTGSATVSPSLHCRENEIVLERGGTFTLDFAVPISRADTHLVIDIYDLDNPVHPAGHLGWWRYNLGQFGHGASGHLIEGDCGPEPRLIGSSPDDHWQTAEPLSPQRWLIIVVLRSSITNAIISLRRIPAFRSEAELLAFRAGADWIRRIASDAPANYLLPAGTRVHLVAQNVFQRDAVGNLMIDLYRMLKAHQVEVRLFADNFALAMSDVMSHRDRLASHLKQGDIVVYSFSIYDPHLPDLLAHDGIHKIAYFHGVTQPRLLQVFDPELSAACGKAIQQIPLLAEFDAIATNSRANQRLLQNILAAEQDGDVSGVTVIPPLLLIDHDAALLTAHRARANSSALTSGRVETSQARPDNGATGTPLLLYVGRIKSHKRIEDILHLLSEYRKLEPSARVLIIGESNTAAYADYLRWVQFEQLMLPADAAIWAGTVSEQALLEAYASAAAYVSMSEDEGFCIPVFEAMACGVPVFAYANEAVRETLGDLGVVFSQKSFPHLAAQLHLLLKSSSARNRTIEAQLARARAMMAEMDGRGFMKLLFDALQAGALPDRNNIAAAKGDC